ncbi:MAG TPA: endonuclease/exonuclease/phosphatase family protein, partial [Arachnia sp.]|nr:endonuclease/exonuclease/phosphatase family protein [Arachnia sp.]
LGQQPDVIGLQEVSQGKLGETASAGQPNLSQAEDLVDLLGEPYWMANEARYNCANPASPYKCKAKDQGAANSQKIVYNSKTVKLLKQGSKKTTSAKTKMEQYRYVEWAIFRHKKTGKQFFFANVHLDPGKDAKTIKIRATQMKEILALITAKNPNKLPAYVVGDFNSHKWTDGGNKPYETLIKAGYVDPLGNTWMSMRDETTGATVEKRINTQSSSHNDWDRVAAVKPTGWTAASSEKPWLNGIYIDYIWTSKGIEVPEWETVVDVDKKTGRFKGTIPSDHNMLRATTIIR